MNLTPTQAAHVASVFQDARLQMAGFLARGVAVGIGPQCECGPDVPPIAIWVVEKADFWIDCCNTTAEAKAKAVSLGLRVVHVIDNAPGESMSRSQAEKQAVWVATPLRSGR